MHIHPIGDVAVLNDYAEVPGLGFLPVNAFVLHTEQPVVIDSGLSTLDKDFVSAVAEVLDPADVRWLWITRPDRDHTGGLWQLLQAAPAARPVTTFLGLEIMSCEWAIPFVTFNCCGHRLTAHVCNQVDPAPFRATVDSVRAMGSLRHFQHPLPAVPQPDDQLYETVLLAPQTTPLVGPDQAALHALLASFESACNNVAAHSARRWPAQCHSPSERRRSNSQIYGAKFDHLQMIKKQRRWSKTATC